MYRVVNEVIVLVFCCFKQKTAYEMRISDWSSDVCSSDLLGFEPVRRRGEQGLHGHHREIRQAGLGQHQGQYQATPGLRERALHRAAGHGADRTARQYRHEGGSRRQPRQSRQHGKHPARSEEHTSELQSLMRTSYAVFCLQKKTKKETTKK